LVSNTKQLLRKAEDLKFEPQLFYNGLSYGFINYCIEVPLNGTTTLLNFMKIYQVVQKISIDPSNLKPVTPLGPFCLNVNNMVTIVVYSKDLGCCHDGT
jgi:hypothetical protein